MATRVLKVVLLATLAQSSAGCGRVTPLDTEGDANGSPEGGASVAHVSGGRPGSSSSESVGGTARGGAESPPRAVPSVSGGAAGPAASQGTAAGGVTSPPPASASGGSSVELPPTLPDGLVVHEWGTNTVVSASDGTLELGLQHEEEDLPPFVYDRIRAAVAEPMSAKVTTKMETPVLYFYSKQPLDVSVRVDFPAGVLTQWYPGVVDFRPPILWENPAPPRDPAMDTAVALPSVACETRYRVNGWLDWGQFKVLAPGESMPAPPVASLDEYTWSFARDVAANLLQFKNGESERYLFYRGVSSAVPPAVVKAFPLTPAGQKLTLQNPTNAAFGSLFVINVNSQGGAFNAYDGVPAQSQRELAVPTNDAFVALPEYTAALSEAMVQTLKAQHLFHDEAVAMVNTWKRQWFTTPGVRVLYLAPESWTNETIPLQISPQPAELVRVMVVRTEVLTPDLEASDLAALAGTDEAAVASYFSALGRFAEPRLRRALAVSPSSAGAAYLAKIAVQVARPALNH